MAEAKLRGVRTEEDKRLVAEFAIHKVKWDPRSANNINVTREFCRVNGFDMNKMCQWVKNNHANYKGYTEVPKELPDGRKRKRNALIQAPAPAPAAEALRRPAAAAAAAVAVAAVAAVPVATPAAPAAAAEPPPEPVGDENEDSDSPDDDDDDEEEEGEPVIKRHKIEHKELREKDEAEEAEFLLEKNNLELRSTALQQLMENRAAREKELNDLRSRCSAFEHAI
jgi:hypothetical protein